MKKNKNCNIISSLTEYYKSIGGNKFSIKSIFKFFYCIIRFFWILLVFIYNVISFIIVTGIYLILGKTCQGCKYIKRENEKETKWCTIYHIKLNRRCRDYKIGERI